MTSSFEVYFSNQVEFLLHAFKERIYKTPSAFTRRLVIVSSPALKSWLMLQLAKDPAIGIAAGMEIYYLDEALEKLSRSGEGQDPLQVSEGISLADLLSQTTDEEQEISPQGVAAIRRRIRGGLAALTQDDIEIIERLSAALDSASEMLYRRIQK